jgi:hypothetical protein
MLERDSCQGLSCGNVFRRVISQFMIVVLSPKELRAPPANALIMKPYDFLICSRNGFDVSGAVAMV